MIGLVHTSTQVHLTDRQVSILLSDYFFRIHYYTYTYFILVHIVKIHWKIKINWNVLQEQFMKTKNIETIIRKINHIWLVLWYLSTNRLCSTFNIHFAKIKNINYYKCYFNVLFKFCFLGVRPQTVLSL